MQQQCIKHSKVFQEVLFRHFHRFSPRVVETLMFLSLGHLFGLYTPNQLSDALDIPKSSLYRHLKALSVGQWRDLLVEVGCSEALEALRAVSDKSASTLSRLRPTINIDDSLFARYKGLLSYCYPWWSKKHGKSINSQAMLGITLKIGSVVYPLNLRLIGKQGRGNTDKPSCVLTMLEAVLSFFDEAGLDLRGYPLTFDSWYGSHNLIAALTEMGFESILIHGKSNYVMTIAGVKAKLSAHKQTLRLSEHQCGCDKPVKRVCAKNPTFGHLQLLFFEDMGKVRTMMAFGKTRRACEILRIWKQHHGIEQF